ncbi:MAG: hypothetical protein NW220_19660 [Leptolyngbyaceae cyanobacterium bins.349]|nr:hypothetical protein [Leptolyngbyaceae cyanobacterium bins.349]
MKIFVDTSGWANLYIPTEDYHYSNPVSENRPVVISLRYASHPSHRDTTDDRVLTPTQRSHSHLSAIRRDRGNPGLVIDKSPR